MDRQRKRYGCGQFLSKTGFLRIIWIAVLTAGLLCACTGTGAGSSGGGSLSVENTPLAGDNKTQAADAVLKIHYLDVGQGDSTLIESAGHYMLVDAGEREEGPGVVAYLKDQGVKRLDYVIGTHPHSDHIGGLADVLAAFPVDCVLIPEKEHTTRAYERLLDGIERQGLTVTLPVVGDVYQLGDASFQILAPNRDYEDDLNNWSMGFRLTYGDNHFVFCGDAKKEAEADICGNGLELSADVLKLSHHGSYSSSSKHFVDRVNPEYVVISCGRDNDYGYPHEVIKKMIASRGLTTYRTDEQGTITAVSDGHEITWSYTGVGGEQGTSGSAATRNSTGTGNSAGTGDSAGIDAAGNPTDSAAAFDYILNTNTRRFHLPSCQSAADMKEFNRKEYSGSREDLIGMGYAPCQSCKP